MSDFGIGEFGDDTEALYNHAMATLANLQVAPGKNLAMTQIEALVTQEQGRLDGALASGDTVQFKGFLQTMNSMLRPLETQMGNQAAPVPATLILASQLIVELRAVQSSM